PAEEEAAVDHSPAGARELRPTVVADERAPGDLSRRRPRKPDHAPRGGALRGRDGDDGVAEPLATLLLGRRAAGDAGQRLAPLLPIRRRKRRVSGHPSPDPPA